MATNPGTMVSGGDTWNLQDQIEQLHGLIKLSNKDEKGFRAGSQNKIQLNELRIAELRTDINSTKKALFRMVPEDERLLRSAFIRHPNEYRVVKDKSSAEARVYMDEQVLQLHRELECLRVQRQQQEQRLLELSNRLTSVRNTTLNGPDNASVRLFESLDNNLNKARIRADTARVIRDRYALILYNLQLDERSYPELISKLDKAAQDQSSELQDVKLLCLQAQEVRDNLKETLNAMEFEIFQVKQERETFINVLRKEVEKRNEAPETKKSKMQEEVVKDDTKAAALQASEAIMLRNFKQAHEKLLGAANVADLKNFWTSWKRLSKASRHLREQLVKSAERSVRLNEERTKLTEVVQEMRFSSGLPVGQELFKTQLQENVQTHRIQQGRTTRNMHNMGALLQDIRLGLESLVTRLADVELQPTFSYALTGNEMVDNLLRCDAVLRLLLAIVDQKFDGDVDLAFRQIMEEKTGKAEDFTIASYKIRITFVEKRPKMATPTYMREDAEISYGPTREMVKAVELGYLDGGTKKKKRKKRKQRIFTVKSSARKRHRQYTPSTENVTRLFHGHLSVGVC